jgi:hypothetical protein
VSQSPQLLIAINLLIPLAPTSIDANINATGDELTVECVSSGRRNTFGKLGDRWVDAKAFFGASLEVGKVSSFSVLGSASPDRENSQGELP